ncbi:MAG: hypothetical protein HY329_06915 [Chloroflexi bacterium]|nr:hypothetical protein [Chloroflexota bacterium]
MNLHALLRSLRVIGVTLEAVNGWIEATPASLLTDGQRSAIREHRGALLDLLAAAGGRLAPNGDLALWSLAPGDLVWQRDYATHKIVNFEPQRILGFAENEDGVDFAIFEELDLKGRRHRYGWYYRALSPADPCPRCDSSNRFARPDGIVECRECRAVEEVPTV